MIIGVTGASGFIGRHLVHQLGTRGHQTVAFSRTPERPVAGCRETRAFRAGRPVDLTGLDAVVNLAGESILGYWSAEKKRRIHESRVAATARLAEAFQRAAHPPRCLVSGSATGYYGSRGDEELREESPPGQGFLASVAQAWEAAAQPAQAAGARVALLRTGFVLGSGAPTTDVLRTVFGLGVGGPLGDGRQWMSLVHVEDVAALIVWLLERPDAAGPYNAVGPDPVRNADFTRQLARTVRRPAFLAAPGFALKGLLGDLSSLLLDSQRVLPARAVAGGYPFRFGGVESILADVFGA